MNIDCLMGKGLQSISGNSDASYLISVQLTPVTKDDEDLQTILRTKVYGDILNLPKNIMALTVGGSTITGSIEDFVARMRTEGRTSGSVALSYANVCRGIQYDGYSLYSQVVAENIPYDTTNQVTYLTWDASDISFTTTPPTGMSTYYPAKAFRYWTPYE